MSKTYKDIFLIIILIGVILFPSFKVNAANNFTIDIQSNKSSIIVGEEATFTIAIQNINGTSEGINACTSVLNMSDSSKLEFVSVSGLNGWNAVYGTKLAFDGAPTFVNATVASFKFKGLVAGTVTITPTADDCADGIYEYTGNSNSIAITVKNPPSNNANLSSLSLSNGSLSPSFNANTINYTATINNASTVINASPVAGATITGHGTKSLSYGNNSFKITVTAEDGVTKKVYNINITRPDNRSTNNKLSALSLSAGSISFSPNINSYNIVIPSEVSSFSVLSATAQDSKSSISYNNKTISLNYGETKTISVIVTSEAGLNNTYYINVTRTDGRSDNNYLKTLSIKGISMVFNKNTLNYSQVVENSLQIITIEALSEDVKATIQGLGTKNLIVGSNTFQVKVISEKGREKIYTIVLIKKDENNQIPGLSDNAFLKNLKINDQEIQFDKNTFEYKLYLESINEKAIITFEKEDEKSTIALNGNQDLVFGVNNFEITVTAENGSIKKYKVTIIRKNNLIEERLSTSQKLSVSNSLFKNAKKGYQDLRFIINSSDNIELYRWDFKFEDLKNVGISPKLEILINKSKYNKEILKLTKLDKITNLTFLHEGELPGKSIITLDLSRVYQNGNIVNLYFYDKDKNTIKLIKDNINVINGKIIIDIEHCSEYFLTDNLIPDSQINDVENSSIIFYVIIAVITIVIVSLGLLIYLRLKKVNKNKDME